MIFSKKTLFAAALFASTAFVASAVAEDLTPDRDIAGNLTVESDFNIDLGGNTITLNGALLSADGSLAEQGLTQWNNSGDKVTITGGGTLTYTGGGLGSGYYTDTYSINRNNESADPGSDTWDAWAGMSSFWSAGIFTGTVVVDTGTTLSLQGQLSQYVRFVKPTKIGSTTNYSVAFSGYAGAQSVVLKDGATLSFAGTSKNMVNSRPNLTATDPESGYNPSAELALNFVNNLVSTSSSRIVIGTDPASINRIVFNADADIDSTVGRLVGNGRIYTTGDGTISFIGESELNSGSNGDTSGNTWISGNRLADIILGTKIVNVGSANGTAVVDNVFENATAVHLVSGSDNANVNLYLDDLGNVSQGGAILNGAAYYLADFAGTQEEPNTVNIYGNQVFNNFQSLWVDRTLLLSDPDTEVSTPKTSEPVRFTTTVGDNVNKSYGSGTKVELMPGAVLTINQDQGRDGRYYGNIITWNTGLVVKTGSGRFVYCGKDTIERLRIEEGEWIFDGEADTDITLAKTGQLTVVVGGTGTSDFSVQAIDSSTVLRLVADYSLVNDLTQTSLEDLTSGDGTENLSYRAVRYSSGYAAREIQIVSPQTLFYGKVLVEDGITLTLGSENSTASVFSGASSIELVGETGDSGQWQASKLAVTGTQLVRNLIGASGSSAVTIDGAGILVLTNTGEAATYAGGFAGSGNLVKLGDSVQHVYGNAYGELTGSLSVLSGSVSVDQGGSSSGISGLVLKAGTSAGFTSASKIGALIGEDGSTVSSNGTLTVGGNAKPTGPGNGSYFATSEYGAYRDLFSGTGVESVQTYLEKSASNSRQYQPASGASYETVGTDGTLAYLKNPAQLVYKTDPDKLDGAFASLYTSTGVDRNGVDVFAAMSGSDAGAAVFGGAKTVSEWLRKVFNTTDVSDFISSAGAHLSVSQQQSLMTLAETISQNESGVTAYLDSDGNLNTNGWNAIVAAGGLEFIKAEYPSVTLADDSLYTFITTFYDGYEFVLTQDIATQLKQIYGVGDSGWFVGKKADYNAFIGSFGVSSSEFAGAISGAGSLVKTGTETLTLTGQNSYSGTTVVESGELRVDWNAIQRTSGVSVQNNALLTISATDEDILESYTDPETGDDTGYEANDGYGSFFSGSKASSARLSGSGVVLKLGDGKVDLGNALADVASGSSDFSGSFLVADGSLKATVDSVVRTEAQTPLAFNIYFSTDENSVGTPEFELAFARTGNVDYIVGTQASELEFTGTIDGKDGAFTLDTGVSRPDADTASVNNVLSVASENLNVGTVNIKSGTFKLAVSGDGDWFDTAVLSQNSALHFDLSNSAVLSDAKIVGNDGKLIVSSLASQGRGTYAVNKLELSGGALTGISSLELFGGATLSLAGELADPDAMSDVVLSALKTEAQTVLEIGENRTVELSGSGEIAGTLSGEGTFVFNGNADSVLTLGNADAVRETVAFGGEIVFKGGTIKMLSGEGQTVSYSGLTISEGDSVGLGGQKLVKDGAGTVEIRRGENGSNSITVPDLAIGVLAGELAVSGDMFSKDDGLLPTSVFIETGAKFTFCDVFGGENFDLGDLGALSGTGTLAFDVSGGTSVSVSKFNAAEFSGVIYISENTTLVLGENVTEFSAFSGDGTVEVSAPNLTVRVDGNADGAEKFGGNITGNLQSLTVVGGGISVFAENSIPDGVNEICVGTETENGGVGVAAGWDKKIVAVGATSSVLIDGEDNFSGTVEVRDSVTSLSLSTYGEINLGKDAVSMAFKLEDEDGNVVALDGHIAVTLANVANKDLTLKNLSELNSENFNLKTNAGGGIVFDGSSYSGGITGYNLSSADDQAEWAKDISGAGDVTVKGGAKLKLSAGTLSYTGKTIVSGSSVLEYAAGTVSQSSSLTVGNGSTLIGGVDLVASGSNVTFEGGSNFVFTGDAVRFTGTATANGEVRVTLDPDALDVRGVPVALIEGIGENAVNNISWYDTKTRSGFVINDDTTGLKYLKATTGTDSLVIYVATEDLASIPGVELHEGLSAENVAYLSRIATPEDGVLSQDLSDAETLLAEAIIKTPNGSLAGTLANLSPLSYGAMLALPQSGFISDMSAVSSRIEQRRYDSYTMFTWEIRDDWEFFAQAQGAFSEADDGAADTRTFDMNSYGAIAGMDVKTDATTVAGFAFAYDYGKADIHNGGGDIESHDIRATAFIGKLFAERFYLDAGAQAGFAMFDVKRNTVLGGVDGDTNGWHVGAFANVGMLIPLGTSEDEKSSLSLMPYVGLAYSYYGIGAFDESGAETALDTDSFGASSLRATLGASLAWVTPCFGKTSRLNLDFAYTRELADSEVDIDYGMPGISGNTKFTASTIAFTEDTFSIGPRFSYELDRNNSIYAGYRFEFSTDSDTAHSVNLGFRSRF